MGFIVRVIVNGLAIMLAASLVPGVAVDSMLAALGAGLLLGLINAVVRPILLFLTFPITLLTLGLFIFVLNALCFWLTATVLGGFHVAGFWAVFWGALLVSAVSWLVNALVSDSGRIVVISRRN